MLRTLPILLAGAAVALVTSEAMRRFGWLPGTVAGLVLASNPMFLALAREVRGYSLLVLCAVASTLVVMRDREAGRLGRVAYIVAAGVGVGTHLFMGWVMVGHVLFLWVRRRLNSEWVFRLVAATLIGAVPYILTLDVILHQGRMRTMVAVFPFRVVRNVLGGEPVTVAVLGGVCLFAIWSVRRDRRTTILGAAAVAAVVITWLAPNEPAARFFVWSVPAVAMAAAVAVHHRAVVALPVLVAVVAAALSVRPDYTEDPLANRRLAPIIEAAIDDGRTVCALGGSTETLPVYTHRLIPGYFDLARFNRCDVAIAVILRLEPELLRALAPSFPYRREIPARESAVVLSKEPLPSSPTGRRR